MLTQRLDLRQSQSLVMTPQLQQAIKLLQLNNLELSGFVEQELERNPLLERDDGERAVAAPDPETLPGITAGADSAAMLDGGAMAGPESAPLDAAPADLYGGDDGSDLGNLEAGQNFKSGASGSFEDDESSLEQTLAAGISLQDHLRAQMQVEILDPAERMIALHLIDLVEDSGWLTADLDEVAVFLGITSARVEAVLARLQRFDPTGVCARGLAECLALQLKERNRFDPAMAAMIAHLPLLAARDVEGLKRVCGVDTEDLQDMIAEIRALNPKPGLAFAAIEATPVIPDILMRLAQDGSWLIELNAETLPRVLVNRRYFTKINRDHLKKDEKDYLSEQLQSANWLVKSLDQRAATIMKVAAEIVRQQDGFFRHGVAHLRPLILRQIAEAIGMHESTVSRVTTNKYIQTPRGLYELKYFFTSSIAASGGGEAHSAEAVRHRIKTLIDAEAVDDILSDDKLVEILKKDGIDIARRTVAKYREALKIPSSVQRRRIKSSAL